MRPLSFGAAVVAFLLAAQLPAVGADAGLQYRVLPPGEVSCASWTRGREVAGKGNSVFLTQDGVSRAEREGWVHGYFSALNIELLPADRGARRDVTEGIDRDALMAMVDEYCAANPLDSLLGATTSIGATLTRDWLAAHPVSGAGAPVARPSIPAVTVPPRAEAPIVGSPPVVQLPPPAPEMLPPPRQEPPAPPRVATAQTPTPVPSPPPHHRRQKLPCLEPRFCKSEPIARGKPPPLHGPLCARAIRRSLSPFATICRKSILANADFGIASGSGRSAVPMRQISHAIF